MLNKNLTLLFAFLLLLSTMATAQTHYYQWAHGIGSNFADIGKAISLDEQNNLYVAGFFQDTADFDPGNSTTKLGADARGLFIQKFDTAANLMWAKRLTSAGTIMVEDLLTDGSGNFYITGHFGGRVDFNPGSGFEYLEAKVGDDIFLAKYDASGNLIWANVMKGDGVFATGYALSQDPAGKVYMAGEFGGTVDFDPGTNSRELTSSDERDAFIQKLNPNGSLVWAKAIGGPEFDFINGLAIDPNGNIYAGGGFESSIDLNPGNSVNNFSSNGRADFFVVKLNDAGQYQWGYTSGSAQGDELIESIEANQNGKIYTSGFFTNTVDFKPGPGSNSITVKGFRDIFVQKLDAQGNSEWVEPIGGPGEDKPKALHINQQNGIFMTGFFTDSIRFNQKEKVVSIGKEDVLMYQMSQDGDFGYARNIGSAKDDRGVSVTANDQGDLFLTGSFQGSMAFGSGNFPFLLNSAGKRDIFSLRLTQCLDTTLSQNGAQLTANQEQGTYQWLDCSNGLSPVNNANQQTFQPESNGRYAVALASDGCTDTSACYQVQSVGRDLVKSDKAVSIFPIPAKDQLTFQAPTSYQGGRYQLKSLKGQTLRSGPIQKPASTNVKVAELPSGLYLLMIQNGETQRFQKVVIQ